MDETTAEIDQPTRDDLANELAVATDELRRTREELDRAQRLLASNVSHELRQPLATIQGYVELLEDGELGQISPSSSSAIRTIGRNAERLATLLDDLLQAPVHSEPTLELAEVDVGGIVRESQVALRSVARSRGLDFAVSLSPMLRRIRADRDQVEQVVMNLVGNALKFTPDGGRVSVVVESASDGIVLVVSDTGIGIPEHEVGSLFSRFFRSSLSVNRGIEGHGLGLAVTKSIVDHHRGHITVDSQEGVGTTVRVALPVDPSAQGGVSAWRRSHHSPTNGSTSGTNPYPTP